MRGTEGTLAFLKLTQQIDTQFVDSGAEGGLALIAFPYVLTMTVVPANQADAIDKLHELDPVHQVDHKDEHTEDDGRNNC